MKEPSGAERRRHPRAAIAASAIVLAGSKFAGTFVVENLSAGGALLVGDPIVGIGQRIKVILTLITKPPVSLVAQLLRTEVRDTGEKVFVVEFRNVPAATQDRIQRAVLAALEQKTVVEALPVAPMPAVPAPH
jgi:c-di-GMP-binding flagellar brake protein YcgR